LADAAFPAVCAVRASPLEEDEDEEEAAVVCRARRGEQKQRHGHDQCDTK